MNLYSFKNIIHIIKYLFISKPEYAAVNFFKVLLSFYIKSFYLIIIMNIPIKFNDCSTLFMVKVPEMSRWVPGGVTEGSI